MSHPLSFTGLCLRSCRHECDVGRVECNEQAVARRIFLLHVPGRGRYQPREWGGFVPLYSATVSLFSFHLLEQLQVEPWGHANEWVERYLLFARAGTVQRDLLVVGRVEVQDSGDAGGDDVLQAIMARRWWCKGRSLEPDPAKCSTRDGSLSA